MLTTLSKSQMSSESHNVINIELFASPHILSGIEQVNFIRYLFAHVNLQRKKSLAKVLCLSI